MTIFIGTANPRRLDPLPISTGPVGSVLENTRAAFQSFQRNSSFLGQRSEEREAFAERIDAAFELTGRRLPNPVDEDSRRLRQATGGFGGVSDITGARPMSRDEFESELNAIRAGLPPDQASRIGTLEEMNARLAERAREAAGAAEELAGRSGAAGTIGGLAGTLVAAAIDAPTLISLPFGAPAASSIVRFALTEAVLAGASEAAFQPAIQARREELGLERESALANIAAASLGGGLLGGGLRAVAGGVGRLAARRRAAREDIDGIDPATASRDRIADVLRETERRLDDAGSGAVEDVRGLREAVEREAAEGIDSAPFRETPEVAREYRTREREATAAVNELRSPRMPDRPAIEPRSLPLERQALVEPILASRIEIDAERFQFKTGGDRFGVTDRLEGVREFDAVKANTVVLWEDASGRLFVADGHQRVGLAKRIGGESGEDIPMNAFILREADGISDAEARIIAASRNISEGSGTAIDAAKILREAPDFPFGLPPRSAFVRQAQALSELSPDAFRMVINEIVPANFAAIVGRRVRDPDLQASVLATLSRTEPANEVQAEAIVRQALAATDRRTQTTLFGEETVTETLFADRARILDKALRKVRRDRTTFRTVVEEESRLAAEGNVLSRESNMQRSEIDGEILQLVQTAATRRGAVSDALTEAARRARGDGGDAGAVNDFVAALRRAAESGDLRRGGDGGSFRLLDDAGDDGAGAANRSDGAAARTAADSQPAPGRSLNERARETLREFDDIDGEAARAQMRAAPVSQTRIQDENLPIVDRSRQAARISEVNSRRRDIPIPRRRLRDNFLVDLSVHTPVLFRETNADGLLDIAPFSNRATDLRNKELFFADVPSLALGQGKNVGVFIELDARGLKGKVNMSKPASADLFQQGTAEFIGRLNTQSTLQKAVTRITLAADLQATRQERKLIGTLISNLERNGWIRQDTNGEVTITNPNGFDGAANRASENPADITQIEQISVADDIFAEIEAAAAGRGLDDIPISERLDTDGNPVSVRQSARELADEIAEDMRVADQVRGCAL